MTSFRTLTRSTVLAAAAVLALRPALLGAPQRVHAGQWEVSTPHVDGEPDSEKVCIGAEEAASINGGAATARAYQEKKLRPGCRINEYTVTGDLISSSVTCGKVTVRTKGRYHGDTFEGDRVIQREGQPDVAMHLKGKRLGDCPPGETPKR